MRLLQQVGQRGLKLYVAREVPAMAGYVGFGASNHNEPVILINPFAPPTVEVPGNVLAHEVCHVFTLGANHMIDDKNDSDPNNDQKADAGGHSDDKGNLMYPSPGGTNLKPDQVDEVNKGMRPRANTKQEPPPPPRARYAAGLLPRQLPLGQMTALGTKHALFVDTRDDGSPSYADITDGMLFASGPAADLQITVNLAGLYPTADVNQTFEVFFNTDGNVATGPTFGAFAGIDTIVQVTLAGHYPFTAPAGSLVAQLVNPASNSSTALTPGHIDRVQTLLDADPPIVPAPDSHDSLRQSVPLALFGPLANTVPVGVRLTQTGSVPDEATVTFDFNLPPGPEIAMTPRVGRPGETLAVTGRRFSPSSAVTVLVDDTAVATGQTLADGSLSMSFAIPAVAFGRHFVTAQDGGGLFDFSIFYVGALLDLGAQGGGFGIISAAGASAVECGQVCRVVYPFDTSLTLVARPAADSASAGWSGDADCQDGVVTLSASRTCTANFVSLPVGLPLDLTGGTLADAFAYNPRTGGWSFEIGNGAGGLTPISGAWSPDWILRPADFNGDGAADLFLYNVSNGLWFEAIGDRVGGFTYVGGAWSPGWSPYVRDLDGDNVSDVFIYNPTNGLWFKAISDRVGGFTYFGGAWSPQWEIYTLELNGDRFGDLFLHNAENGLWFRAVNDGGAGFTLTGGAWSPNWRVFSSNFNGDLISDLFLYNATNGLWFIVINDGHQFSYIGGAWSPDWVVRIADINADAFGDVFVYNTTSGLWFECVYNGAGGFTYYGGAWSPNWRVFVTDFNNDRRRDILVYNPTTGQRVQCINTGLGTFTYVPEQWDPGLDIVATRTRLP